VDTNRPENITKLTKLEIEVKAEKAAILFDTFTEDTLKNLTPKQAFILGYLHGTENAFDEIGMFDDIDDDSKIYEFLKDNDKYNKPRS
jgi:hypothetical protein